MLTLVLLILTIACLLYVMRIEAGAFAAVAVLAVGAVISFIFASGWLGFVLTLGAIAVAVTGLPSLRKNWLSPKLFDYFKKVAPKVSPTEQVALDAGTVFWDGELFTGRPDWSRLLDQPLTPLSEEEQAFVDHQCSVAVGMCNAFEIANNRADLPPELWEYLGKEKFFGMIIPKKYGGLGLSAKAQTAVLQKLAVNESLMVTVGVPNSLGPGELLLKYGSEEQKEYYLPRLADGREIPCFGLTGPRAGSDATSLPDTGVVCKGMHEGEEVLGLRLNFEKRWITLAPIATVVGLAFRVFDPDRLLGDVEDLGLTCALVPRETEGMQIGRRHWPTGQPFLNGPILGKDVFIPLDYIIGGTEMIGHGWKMLIECLSVGRAITLPSGGAGSGRYAVATAGGFTRIRRQFNVPVAEMEGVQAPLAEIAGKAYIAQTAVMHTANMIDNGVKPSVPSAILKYHLTEYQRDMYIAAMDVHGGKAVTIGPRNYLAYNFASLPVSITVEGANILTRSLMIFGQGAIRCHPYVLDELAAKKSDSLQAFDKAFFAHAGLIFGNFARSLTLGLGIGKTTSRFDHVAAPYAAAVGRFSAVFGLCADAAMASLGADLKKRELISARLGDVLSNLYLLSMVLKHWHETQAVRDEDALLHYSAQLLLNRIEEALLAFYENLPSRALGKVLKFFTMPLGRRWPAPGDKLVNKVAGAISTDTPLRTMLTSNTWKTWEEGQVSNPLYHYQRLLRDYPRAEKIYRTVNKAYAGGKIPASALHPEARVEEALKAELISADDAEFMRGYEAEVLSMLTVDDFAFDQLAADKDTVIEHRPGLMDAEPIAGEMGSETSRMDRSDRPSIDQDSGSAEQGRRKEEVEHEAPVK